MNIAGVNKTRLVGVSNLWFMSFGGAALGYINACHDIKPLSS
jgi:hypothetical protein